MIFEYIALVLQMYSKYLATKSNKFCKQFSILVESSTEILHFRDIIAHIFYVEQKLKQLEFVFQTFKGKIPRIWR